MSYFFTRSRRNKAVVSFLILIASLGLLGGCAPKAPKTPQRPPAIVHEVRYPGETLAIIAGWYTGDPKNWKDLATFNEGIAPNKIMIGDQIEIPRYLLKRENPFTKEYVKKFSKTKSIDTGSNSKPVTPSVDSEPSKEGTEVSTDTTATLNSERVMPPSEDVEDTGDTSAAQQPSNEVGTVNEPPTEGDKGVQAPNSGNTEAEREALREKTRFELLEEILKGEEKGAEAQPSAADPKQDAGSAAGQ